VLLLAKNTRTFEVFENGTKLFDGPATLEIVKGKRRTVLIKAIGFKNRTIVVDEKERYQEQEMLSAILRSQSRQ